MNSEYIYLHYLLYSCIAFFLSSFFKHLSINFFLLFSKTCKMYLSIFLYKCIYIFDLFHLNLFLSYTWAPHFLSLCLYSLSQFMLSFYRYIKVRVIQVLGTGPQVGKGGHPCIGKCDDQKCTKVFKKPQLISDFKRFILIASKNVPAFKFSDQKCCSFHDCQ